MLRQWGGIIISVKLASSAVIYGYTITGYNITGYSITGYSITGYNITGYHQQNCVDKIMGEGVTKAPHESDPSPWISLLG